LRRWKGCSAWNWRWIGMRDSLPSRLTVISPRPRQLALRESGSWTVKISRSPSTQRSQFTSAAG
jgi:hypothetical protein